jgi:hypothetical protein
MVLWKNTVCRVIHLLRSVCFKSIQTCGCVFEFETVAWFIDCRCAAIARGATGEQFDQATRCVQSQTVRHFAVVPMLSIRFVTPREERRVRGWAGRRIRPSIRKTRVVDGPLFNASQHTTYVTSHYTHHTTADNQSSSALLSQHISSEHRTGSRVWTVSPHHTTSPLLF